jgi:hypothetical protein
MLSLSVSGHSNPSTGKNERILYFNQETVDSCTALELDMIKKKKSLAFPDIKSLIASA